MYYFFIIMLTNKTKMTIIAYNSVTKLQTYLDKIYVAYFLIRSHDQIVRIRRMIKKCLIRTNSYDLWS